MTDATRFVPTSGIVGDINSSTAHLWSQGLSLSGSITYTPNDGLVSPFHVSIGSDTANASGIATLSIFHQASTGHSGKRHAVSGNIRVSGTPASNPGGYVAGIFTNQTSANLGGTSGPIQNYKGTVFGFNANVYITSGCTYVNRVANEINVSVASGASCGYKYGLSIIKTNIDAVQGDYDDVALSIHDQDGASPWKYGISFGSYGGQWAFDSGSTLIGVQKRQAPLINSPTAKNGIDLSDCIFSGSAFKASGFSVDGSGNAVINSLTLLVVPPVYADDTAAKNGGVDIGGLYRVGSTLKVRVL